MLTLVCDIAAGCVPCAFSQEGAECLEKAMDLVYVIHLFVPSVSDWIVKETQKFL